MLWQLPITRHSREAMKVHTCCAHATRAKKETGPMLRCPTQAMRMNSAASRSAAGSNTAGLLISSHVNCQEHHTGTHSRCNVLMQHACRPVRQSCKPATGPSQVQAIARPHFGVEASLKLSACPDGTSLCLLLDALRWGSIILSASPPPTFPSLRTSIASPVVDCLVW